MGMARPDYKKVFPSYDYDLCDNEKCERRHTCKRFLTWRQAIEENYPYPLWLVVDNKQKCWVYVPIDDAKE